MVPTARSSCLKKYHECFCDDTSIPTMSFRIVVQVLGLEVPPCLPDASPNVDVWVAQKQFITG